jgi:hypothetical protein
MSFFSPYLEISQINSIKEILGNAGYILILTDLRDSDNFRWSERRCATNKYVKVLNFYFINCETGTYLNLYCFEYFAKSKLEWGLHMDIYYPYFKLVKNPEFGMDFWQINSAKKSSIHFFTSAKSEEKFPTEMITPELMMLLTGITFPETRKSHVCESIIIKIPFCETENRANLDWCAHLVEEINDNPSFQEKFAKIQRLTCS